MIDPGLVAYAKQAIAAKSRASITPAILIAVVLQESHGVPYFVDTKPGSILAMNLNDAIEHRVRHKDATGKMVTVEIIKTGLDRATILDIITIKEKVGDFAVPRAMVSKLAKFRFEYGYWKKYPQLALKERFIYSCSWGLVQFMGPNISKQPDAKGIEFIKRFAADVPMQMVYGAGMIDDLLKKNRGDIAAMYRAYNSGTSALSWKNSRGEIRHQSAEVIARGKAVQRSAIEIAKYLKMER